jgi:hypothetical protein
MHTVLEERIVGKNTKTSIKLKFPDTEGCHGVKMSIMLFALRCHVDWLLEANASEQRTTSLFMAEVLFRIRS